MATQVALNSAVLYRAWKREGEGVCECVCVCRREGRGCENVCVCEHSCGLGCEEFHVIRVKFTPTFYNLGFKKKEKKKKTHAATNIKSHQWWRQRADRCGVPGHVVTAQRDPEKTTGFPAD